MYLTVQWSLSLFALDPLSVVTECILFGSRDGVLQGKQDEGSRWQTNLLSLETDIATYKIHSKTNFLAQHVKPELCVRVFYQMSHFGFREGVRVDRRFVMTFFYCPIIKNYACNAYE